MLLLLFVVDVLAHIVVVIVDLEPRPAVRRAVAGLPRLEPGWERLQGEGHHDHDQQGHHDHGQQGQDDQDGDDKDENGCGQSEH